MRPTNGARTMARRSGWIGLWLCAQALMASAADDTGRTEIRTRWGCQVADQWLNCIVERSGSAPAVLTADARLPAIVRDLRQRPAGWRGRTVRIPLFNHPLDESPVRQLAQAVLCGTADDCEVAIGRERWSTAASWLEFADAHDPLLQRAE